MTRLPIVRKTMRDYRGPAIAMLVTMISVAILDLAIYPSYHASLKDFQIPDALKGFLGGAGSLSSPVGFLTAEFFSWVPLMLVAFAIVAVTGTTAGDEASGALDLFLAQPVGRARVLAGKALGLATLLAVVCVLSYPAFVVTKLFVDFDLGNLDILAAVINMVPISWAFLGMGLVAGVVFPSRSSALTFSFGVMIAAYVIYTLGSAVDLLHSVRLASPFYWADGSQALSHGLSWERTLVFLAVAACEFGVAAVLFERRDIMTAHTWPAYLRWRKSRTAPSVLATE